MSFTLKLCVRGVWWEGEGGGSPLWALAFLENFSGKDSTFFKTVFTVARPRSDGRVYSILYNYWQDVGTSANFTRSWEECCGLWHPKAVRSFTWWKCRPPGAGGGGGRRGHKCTAPQDTEWHLTSEERRSCWVCAETSGVGEPPTSLRRSLPGQTSLMTD